MITLIQLEYIVAVDTYRHYVTASEKCFVTQPTLSMQIKKLEEDLDVVIFDRTKQPIVPTSVGEKIIAQARVTIAESKKINDIIATDKNLVSGELTIGIIPSLAPYLLPLFIGKFAKKYPDVELKVVELLSEEIIKQLKKDLIDVGILVTPLHEKGILERPLFYEEMMLFTNKLHGFAKKENIKTNELATPDLWLLSNGHCFRSQVINLCSYKKDLKQLDHFEYESGSLETIKKLVEVEGGYTLLPELAAMNTSSQTVVKSFKSTKPLREVSLVYTRNYSKKRLLDLLADEIDSSIPKNMLDGDRGQIVEWR